MNMAGKTRSGGQSERPPGETADNGAKLVDSTTEIPALVEFIVKPAGLELVGVRLKFIATFAPRAEDLGNRLGSEHARLKRRMAALDLGKV